MGRGKGLAPQKENKDRGPQGRVFADDGESKKRQMNMATAHLQQGAPAEVRRGFLQVHDAKRRIEEKRLQLRWLFNFGC